MNKNIIRTLIALTVSVSPLARAQVPPVSIDLGTVHLGMGSGWVCGATDTLPTDLYQTSTIRTSGQVSFAPNAYTKPIPNVTDGVQLCVNVTYNLSAFGSFSGLELIEMQDGERVRVIVSGIYQ